MRPAFGVETSMDLTLGKLAQQMTKRAVSV